MNTYSVTYLDHEVKIKRTIEVEASEKEDVYMVMCSKYKVKDTKDILKIRCHTKTKKEMECENV
jgi:hypothetical protein